MSIDGIKSAQVSPSVQAETAKPRDSVALTTVPKPKEVEAQRKPAPPVSAPQIEAIVKQIDSYLKSVSRSIEFSVDKPSGRTVVSVRDSETGDLIRQFPGDEVLRLAEMAHEQTVVLVNEKV